MSSAASSYDPLDARLGRTSGEPVETTKGKPVRSRPLREKSDAANVVLLDAREVTIWRDVDGGFHICVGSPDDFHEVVLPMTVMQVLLRNLDELIGSARG